MLAEEMLASSHPARENKEASIKPREGDRLPEKIRKKYPGVSLPTIFVLSQSPVRSVFL